MNRKQATRLGVQKRVLPGLRTLSIHRRGCVEHFITAVPGAGEPPEAMFAKAAEALGVAKGRVISQDVLGMNSRNGAGMKALETAMGTLQWPVTWIEGADQPGLVGTHLWAIEGVPVQPVRFEGRVVGTWFHDGVARYCRLGDLRPADVSTSRPEQARRVFEQMDAVLKLVGMDFSKVARTWLYLDQILCWYGELNQVRNEFYTRHRVFNGMVPASTGIGGSHASGSALVAGLLAVDVPSNEVQVHEVPSLLQCPAIEYGSSFSRAVEVAGPDYRRLLISGTAGIGPEGRTACLGNVNGQLALTMEVVGAILESRGMAWGDVTRAIAYFKPGTEANLLADYRAAQGIDSIPVQVVSSDICRDDLLFEIELDAMRPLE
ncbi:MAG: hypothetical protein M1608_13405 [Candidatus Omnitrophica bacterium]|nr:hypothetical protein [Candidatus Omnitrophota bacterium]